MAVLLCGLLPAAVAQAQGDTAENQPPAQTRDGQSATRDRSADTSARRDLPAEIPANAELLRDIEVANVGSRSLKCHVLRSKSAARELPPMIVFIHGGAWGSGDREIGLGAMSPLMDFARQGFACASIEYRLSREATFPAAIEDCKAAIRFLRARAAEYRFDPKRIGVVGSSAGGHLAALLGTSGDVAELEGGTRTPSSRVQAVCTWSAPADFLRFTNAPDRAVSAVEGLLGGRIEENRQRAAAASPVTYATRDDPPFLIIHNETDPLVPPAQARALHEALKLAGVDATLQIRPGTGHGVGRGEDFTPVLEFFGRHLQFAIRQEHRSPENRQASARPTEDPRRRNAASNEEDPAGRERNRQRVLNHIATLGGIEVIQDVTFGQGGDRPLKLHIVRPKTQPAGLMPVIVYIHGGAWKLGTKDDGLHHLSHFAQRGYFGVTIEYRLTGEARFPAQIEDCKCAIRYLRAKAREYRLDPARIGVMGGSAGGHLAALLGTSAKQPELEGTGGWAEYSSEVQAVCDCYGPTDFGKWSAGAYSAGEDLIGGTFATLPQRAAMASPITYVRAGTPPFLIVHGDQDPVVPISQSELFHAALVKAGADVQYFIVEGRGHSLLGAGKDQPFWKEIDKFFDTRFRVEQPMPRQNRRVNGTSDK